MKLSSILFLLLTISIINEPVLGQNGTSKVQLVDLFTNEALSDEDVKADVKYKSADGTTQKALGATENGKFKPEPNSSNGDSYSLTVTQSSKGYSGATKTFQAIRQDAMTFALMSELSAQAAFGDVFQYDIGQLSEEDQVLAKLIRAQAANEIAYRLLNTDYDEAYNKYAQIAYSGLGNYLFIETGYGGDIEQRNKIVPKPILTQRAIFIQEKAIANPPLWMKDRHEPAPTGQLTGNTYAAITGIDFGTLYGKNMSELLNFAKEVKRVTDTGLLKVSLEDFGNENAPFRN